MEIINNRDDWALEKLGDFADHEKGKKPKNQSSIQTDVFKHPYVNIKAFEKGIIEAYTDGEKCNFCSENDFLMVWDGSRFGLIGNGIKGATGSTLMKINFPGIENHFAYYFLKSKYLEINSKPKGTGTPHVNPDLLWNYIFPIAPLPEQRAIVSKLEQLFSDLDNSIGNFKKAQAQLKLYRQSVLKNACEGKLVLTEAEFARREGRDYEPADVLLARILEERRENWNGKGKYKEPTPPEWSSLPVLPKGWTWTQIGKICEGIVPGRTKPKEFKGEIPWITLPDIRSLYILKSHKNLGVTKEDAEKVGMKIMPKGSVLMSCVGQFGIICIAGCPVVPNQQLHGFVCPDVIIPEYVAYSLMTQVKQMNKLSAATTIAYINKTKCNSITIPLPPLAEQRRIVTEVERRLSVCDKMEATITESLKKAESLRQSILKKAFEGKLLNEKELEEARAAPDWEPAGKLLERIKAEKINTQTKKKGKK